MDRFKNGKGKIKIKLKNGYLIAGVDEVGRGCLCGPVFSAAVIFKKKIKKSIIKDSKKVNFKKRIILNKYIRKNSLVAIGKASVKEIEKFNILNAALLSMKRAIKNLKKKPNLILIDGNKAPKVPKIKIRTIVKGDEKIPEISAASIVAKVHRDFYMINLSKKIPGYGWHKNFGYGTKQHMSALKKNGVTKFHRKNFSPVHKMLSEK
mgnify:CR=1 FL=1